MVSQVASEKTVFRGLRPLDPTRDLGQLAKLIEEAFGDDISEGGQAALKDLRVLSRLGPLVFLLDYISPEFHEYFSGFVWIENGQVVGNTTVTRTGRLSYRWMISNVAVARAYRRQGIGRQLVAAAIEKARSAGGNDALLRVRVDNDPAQRLYEGFGFKQVAAVTEMELPALREVTPVPAEGFTLRRRHHSEWRQQLDLARQTVPAGMQRLRPVRAGDYRSDLDQRVGRWLRHFFAGRSEHRLAVAENEHFLATLDVTVARWRGSHRLALMIHPDYRGRVDEMLISMGLHLCNRYPRRSVRVKLTTDYEEAIEVLRRYSFVEQRTLALMRLPLGAWNGRSD